MYMYTHTMVVMYMYKIKYLCTCTCTCTCLQGTCIYLVYLMISTHVADGAPKHLHVCMHMEHVVSWVRIVPEAATCPCTCLHCLGVVY